MKYLLLTLLVLFIAVAIGSLIVEDTGYVQLAISGWKIETNLIVFSSTLTLVFIAVYILIRSFIRTWRLPADLRAWKLAKNQSLIEVHISNGLVNMVEGNWVDAEKSFHKAAAISHDPYIIYAQAARAAYESGLLDKQNEYLKLARIDNPDALLITGLIQAELHLKENQAVQAIGVLNSLLEKWPEQNRVKELLMEAYILVNNWQELLELLSTIGKNKYFSHDVIEDKKITAYKGLLNEAGSVGDRNLLNKLWEDLPRKLKKQTSLIVVYITERIRFKDTSDCEVLLKQEIKHNWDRRLINLYGLVISTDADGQLETAESWLNNYKSDPILFLTLGRISIRNSLWTKAKEYLQKSSDIEENADVFFEFAKLYQSQGDYKQASIYYERGIFLKKLK